MDIEVLPAIETEPVEQPGTVAQLNVQSLERLDAAVATYTKRSQEFECLTAQDYIEGGKAVVAIRSLDTLYGDFFTPIKRWWDARKQEVLDDEKKRRGPLATAKELFGTKLLAWKQAEEARQEKIRVAREAAELALAEEHRLQQAAELEARAKETGSAELMQRSLDIMDMPLDIAPTIVGRSVPKVDGFKTVARAQVVVTDLRLALQTIGATLLASDPACPEPLRALLRPLACKSVDGLLDDPARVEKLSAPLATFFKDVAKVRGSAFVMPGVSAGKKQGIG
jgi:hypothetical protein